MEPQVVQFAADGSSKFAGMGDYTLTSPNQMHRVELTYEGEPPHGDSYHRGTIDGRAFPGFIWGCMFAFSSCSRYLVFSWIPKLIERHTVVVNLQEKRYLLLPEYIYDFTVNWPIISGNGQQASGKQFSFNGSETWLPH